MDENFSIQRLQALLLRFWVDKKINLIVLIAIMVLTFSLLNISISNIEVHRIPEKIAFLSIFVKLILLVILIVNLHLAFAKGMGSVNSRHLHLIPASAAEKFFYLFLIGFALPIALYISIFEIINFVFVLLKLSSSISLQQFMFAEISTLNMHGAIENTSLSLKFIQLLIYYLIFHFLVWGLVVFKDYAVLKVLGAIYLAYSVFGFVVFQVFNARFMLDFIATAKRYDAESPEKYSQLSWGLFVIFFTLISGFFYVNYKQFKRKEIKV